MPESRFLRACRRQPVDVTPVWFMRQAGRALPEYRRIRKSTTMLEATTRPELITEITMQPVRRYGVDAAILFSDIVLPLQAVGVDLDIVAGVGPVMGRPIRTAADLAQLVPLQDAHVPYVAEAVRALRGELGDVPLIGFAGAPFTLASYLVEGGPSKNHEHTKALMYGEPGLWHELMERLTAITSAFLAVQIRAGAQAVQLFDSWAGVLPERDYRAHVLPYSSRVLASVAEVSDVPRIHFGVGTGELLGAMGEAGAEVVGVDFRVPLSSAASRVGTGVALQGNLDPAVVFAPPEVVDQQVHRVLEEARDLPGHVFNLGHGVLPGSNPDVLSHIVDLVHTISGSDGFQPEGPGTREGERDG